MMIPSCRRGGGGAKSSSSISVLAKDSAGEVTTTQPQEDVTEGTVAGATTGGVIAHRGALPRHGAVAGVGTFAGPRRL